jgi:hypothetical protein
MTPSKFLVIGCLCWCVACFQAWRGERRAKEDAWDRLTELTVQTAELRADYTTLTAQTAAMTALCASLRRTHAPSD